MKALALIEQNAELLDNDMQKLFGSLRIAPKAVLISALTMRWVIPIQITTGADAASALRN